LRRLSLVLLATIALAVLVASVPVSRGAGIAPPELVLTFTGVQLDDRISYSLVMENRGDLPAQQVVVQAPLPAGLTLADDGGTLWALAFPEIDSGHRVQVGFVALIDPRVAVGTVESVTVFVGYKAPGGSTPYQASANQQTSIAPRGGVPIVAWVGALAGGVLLLLGYAWKVHAETVKIDQLFLLHDSGMLIRHYSNGRGLQKDSDIMSGMLIILQEFVRDSFKDPRSSLEEVRFGDQRVLMARGRHSIMAAIVSGKRLNGLPARLQRAVAGFEETHMDALSRWNGNLETLDSADVAFRSVLAPRYRGFTPT
jgi:uncharacterized repeat protein (TIGR01451 family)